MGIEDLPEIKGFLKTTLIEWEGKVASEIFLGGCNFRCGFCHSRDLVLNPEKLESISYHDVDSSDLAFRIAASKAFKEAMLKAASILMEPVMEVEVVVPEE